jgi:hypothetical protein
VDGRNHYRDSLEGLHGQTVGRMARCGSLGNLDSFLQIPFDLRDSPVDRDAYRQRELPRHPRRRDYKPQRGPCNEPEPTHDFNISCPDRQFFVDTSQRRKHCDWSTLASPQPHEEEG